MIPRNAEQLLDPDAHPEPVLLSRRRNAADAKALEKQQTADAVKALDEEGDLRDVLSLASGAGIRFLARLLEHCNWNSEYFHPSNSVMSYAAGRRAVCRDIENWVSDADYDLWVAVRRQLEANRPKGSPQPNAKS